MCALFLFCSNALKHVMIKKMMIEIGGNMTDKRKVSQGDMLQLEESLNDFLLEAPTGYAGLTSLLTKDKETKSLIFGDEDSIEVLLIALIQYAADEAEMNVFEKILNMQMRLMQVEPEAYQVYADKLNKLNEKGTFGE